MKIIFTIFITTLVTGICLAQVRPVCDEVLEIPDQLSYSGFIITDAGAQTIQTSGLKEMILNVTSDSPTGTFVNSYKRNIAIGSSGFFSISIPREETIALADRINSNPDKSYFISVYYDSKLIGTKEILSVPYAHVANAIGGMGSRGRQGVQGNIGSQGPAGPNGVTGPQGPQGPQGAQGDSGIGTEFRITNAPPQVGVYYIDDGTNTADGKPRLRFNNNGTWIDL